MGNRETVNHRLQLPASLEQIAEAAAEAVAVSGAEGRWRDEVELALIEALTNVVRHSYGDGLPGQIEIEVSRDLERWTCRVIDHGAGMDPADFEQRCCLEFDEPSVDDLDALSGGGRGIPLMAQLVDELSYDRRSEGNVLTLSRQLPDT